MLPGGAGFGVGAGVGDGTVGGGNVGRGAMVGAEIGVSVGGTGIGVSVGGTAIGVSVGGTAIGVSAGGTVIGVGVDGSSVAIIERDESVLTESSLLIMPAVPECAHPLDRQSHGFNSPIDLLPSGIKLNSFADPQNCRSLGRMTGKFCNRSGGTSSANSGTCVGRQDLGPQSKRLRNRGVANCHKSVGSRAGMPRGDRGAGPVRSPAPPHRRRSSPAPAALRQRPNQLSFVESDAAAKPPS